MHIVIKNKLKNATVKFGQHIWVTSEYCTEKVQLSSIVSVECCNIRQHQSAQHIPQVNRCQFCKSSLIPKSVTWLKGSVFSSTSNRASIRFRNLLWKNLVPLDTHFYQLTTIAALSSLFLVLFSFFFLVGSRGLMLIAGTCVV